MRHFFLRDGREFPVACIATEKTPDKIYYALSICNPLDFHCYNPERARGIAEARLQKYLDGGYDNQTLIDPTKPKFPLSKIGTFPYTVNQNVKLSLLALLKSDPELPKRFRAAVSERIAILEEDAKKRQAQGGGDTPASLAK